MGDLTGLPGKAGAEDRAEERKRRAAALYTGTYSHSLDSKGRMVVPQPFREKLGDVFYIAPTRDLEAIGLYSEENWLKLLERYSQLDPAGVNEDILGLLNQFTALSFGDQVCDGQGRVLLPNTLRFMMLEEDKELTVSGEIDHVRVTTTKKYMERFRNVRDGMGARLKAIEMLRVRELGCIAQTRNTGSKEGE